MIKLKKSAVNHRFRVVNEGVVKVIAVAKVNKVFEPLKLLTLLARLLRLDTTTAVCKHVPGFQSAATVT